jgi:SAM-dependent methyltransferase
MRYFITGGAGFIGSNLLDRLLADGHQVGAYDNLSMGIRGFLTNAFSSKNFVFIKGDVLNGGVNMAIGNFKDACYERAWPEFHNDGSSNDERRFKETLSLIPDGCLSILDVGCGDGSMTNRLVPQYKKVVGLDNSEQALKHVKCETVLGSADVLPFPDMNFDLVLCCETLEHLPFEVYPKALKEMERVASKYIIISVPKDEDIKLGMVTCPNCACTFHPWRHLRSFRLKDMETFFDNFRLQNIKVYQSMERRYPLFVIRMAKALRLVNTNILPSYTVCPQCGYSLSRDNSREGNRDRLIVKLLRCLTRWLVRTGKGTSGLIGLYQRVEDRNNIARGSNIV